MNLEIVYTRCAAAVKVGNFQNDGRGQATMFVTRARATRIAHMLPTTGSMRMFRGKQVRVPTSGTPKVDLFGLHEDELRENH